MSIPSKRMVKWLLPFILGIATVLVFVQPVKTDAASGRSLPWNFSYRFTTKLEGKTVFYYNSSKGRLKITMSSNTPYINTNKSFKVTLKRVRIGPDEAVSHAYYPQNGKKSVTFTYEYGGNKLKSGDYYLVFENPHPWDLVEGTGKAEYVK